MIDALEYISDKLGIIMGAAIGIIALNAGHIGPDGASFPVER